jgi:hypothetical protein
MSMRPFLMLYRTRLVVSATLSVVVAVGVLFLTSAEGPTDFGVLWHHFCGCAPEASDARVLLAASTFTCLCMGVIMGSGGAAAGGRRNGQVAAVPSMVYGEMRFLLTRPLRRSAVLLLPVALSVGVVVLFPAAGMLLLLGWLRLVHAPALGHLVDITRLIPGGEGIGQHPSLITVLAATHFGRYYAAAVSVGGCAFALYYVQRWWMHSASKWLRWGSVLTNLVPMVPFLLIHAPGVEAWLFLLSRQGERPALWAIGVHGLFAVGMLWSCWGIAQRLEV